MLLRRRYQCPFFLFLFPTSLARRFYRTNTAVPTTVEARTATRAFQLVGGAVVVAAPVGVEEPGVLDTVPVAAGNEPEVGAAVGARPIEATMGEEEPFVVEGVI